MKRILVIAIVLAPTLVTFAAAAAGPFGILRGRACGPGGCRVRQAAPALKPIDVRQTEPEPMGQPKDTPAPLERWQTHGVDHDKVNGAEASTWSVNGRKVAAHQAIGQLLEDDSRKLWLVLNGEGRERVAKDLAADPKYADLMSRMRVWSVPAHHFSLLDRRTGAPKFPNTGNPSIILMAPDGEVLYQRDGYAGPQDLEPLRQADPEFRPPLLPKKIDPPPKPDEKPPALPAPANPHFPMVPACCIVAAIGAVLYLKSRKP